MPFFKKLALILSELERFDELQVKDVGLEIRKQRAYAISNELQYFFIYSTVLDYIRVSLYTRFLWRFNALALVYTCAGTITGIDIDRLRQKSICIAIMAPRRVAAQV